MTRYVSRSFLLGLAMSVILTAQAKPSLSGTWRLDTGKSDFGHYQAPSFDTIAITQTATRITIAQGTGTELQLSRSYPLDGTEVDLSQGNKKYLKGRARWNGNTLVLETTTPLDN